jgi:hypothetical protein
MIQSSPRIIRLLQNSKPVTLPVLYILFALLFFYSSVGVFIDNAMTNYGYSTSGNDIYPIMQNSDYYNVPAHMISYDAKPYPYEALGTGTYVINNPVDLVQKTCADNKKAESIASSAVKDWDRSSLAGNLVAFMLTWGDDDMHINWSPLSSFFEPRFISLMTDFSSALARIVPKPPLTIAATWGILTVRPAATLLDTQQNRNPVTTYEISAPLPGPVICRDASSL